MVGPLEEGGQLSCHALGKDMEDECEELRGIVRSGEVGAPQAQGLQAGGMVDALLDDIQVLAGPSPFSQSSGVCDAIGGGFDLAGSVGVEGSGGSCADAEEVHDIDQLLANVTWGFRQQAILAGRQGSCSLGIEAGCGILLHQPPGVLWREVFKNELEKPHLGGEGTPSTR